MNRSRLPLLLAVVVLFAMQVACQRDQGEVVSTGPDPGPMPEVNLPPVPDINVERPMQYPDGSISVWNLMSSWQRHLEDTVRVTGYAVEIYRCPYREQMAARDRLVRYRNYLTEEEMAELEQIGMGAGAEPGTGEGTGLGERCNYPHLYIADSMTAENRILVTGYGPALEERLVEGEQYLFEGRFLEETRGFNAAGRGLIFATEISGGSLDLPPPGETEGGEGSIELR